MRARYQNADAGRFWTMDEYEGDNYNPLTQHKYIYANANPVNVKDPSGRVGLSEQTIVAQEVSTLTAIATIIAYGVLTSIQPGIDDIKRRRTPTELYAFGNSKKPRDPRIENHNIQPGQRPDIVADANGMVGPELPPLPNGASTFGDYKVAPLTGHYYSIPKAYPMPEGLGVIADGVDVGGPRLPTHHTIYPMRKMPAQEFIDKFQSLPWYYQGYKPV